MTAATFDTYAAAQTLRGAGFSEPQAAAAVAMVRDAMSEGVATKTDIGELKADIGQLSADIGQLNADMGALEARLTARFYGIAFAIVAANTALTVGLLRLLWPTGGG